nr:hypothetical protein [Tanacetum cinerariifolium]
MKSKHGWVSRKCSRKNVEALKTEEVPTVEPQVVDEDAEYQKVLEESMKDAYALARGTLPPVVIREPKSRKYQPLPEVPGKGKTKVTEEQLDSEEESKKVVLEAEKGGQDKAKVQSITNHVVHARSNHKHMDLDVGDVSPQPSTEQLDEGFTATAYPKVQENLKLAIEEKVLLEKPASSSGTLSSLQHLSRDFRFGDQFFSDKPSEADKNIETKVESMVNVLIQQALSKISLQTSPIIDPSLRSESPKAHQQFKATTTDTTTIITTLPPPQAPQQRTTEAMMVKRIGELEHIMANLIQVNKDMEERLDSHGSRLHTLEQLDIPQQVSIAVSEVVTDAVDWAMQVPLRNHFKDLPEADMKEILHQRMWEFDSYKSYDDHMQLFEALKKSMNRDHSKELAQELTEARKKKKMSRESPKTPPVSPSHKPPPPPPSVGPSGASGAPEASGSAQVPPSPPPPSSTNQESPSKGSAAPSPSKTAASAEYQAWTTTEIRLRPSISLTPADLEMDEDMAPDEQAQSSDDEDIGTLASNYSPPPKDSLLAQTGGIAIFMDWFCKRRGITELKPQDLEGPAYEIIKVFHLDVIHLQYQMEECHKLLTDSVDDPILRHNVSKPLPLGGLPGQVIIQSDFFFNKDLEYLRYDSKGCRPTLSISKMKAAYYPDAGLEQMVPDWIEEEYKYDITAMYGHLNHLLPKDKKILTTAVNLWTRQLVIRQHVEDFQLGIESYQAQLNLTKPHWDATGYEYKHDYTVIDSPRAAIFRDKYKVQMMMRVNEIYKFKYEILDQEGRRSKQGIYVRYSAVFEDKEDLP